MILHIVLTPGNIYIRLDTVRHQGCQVRWSTAHDLGLDDHHSNMQKVPKITENCSKTAFGHNIFFACGALKRASPRGLCHQAQNRLPMPSPSSPSPWQWELQPRGLIFTVSVFNNSTPASADPLAPLSATTHRPTSADLNPSRPTRGAYARSPVAASAASSQS